MLLNFKSIYFQMKEKRLRRNHLISQLNRILKSKVEPYHEIVTLL